MNVEALQMLLAQLASGQTDVPTVLARQIGRASCRERV